MTSGGIRGAVGVAAPYWLRIFVNKSPFPHKRHTVRCVHLQ